MTTGVCVRCFSDANVGIFPMTDGWGWAQDGDPLVLSERRARAVLSPPSLAEPLEHRKVSKERGQNSPECLTQEGIPDGQSGNPDARGRFLGIGPVPGTPA